MDRESYNTGGTGQNLFLQPPPPSACASVEMDKLGRNLLNNFEKPSGPLLGLIVMSH
jgi:hypothetical protein